MLSKIPYKLSFNFFNTFVLVFLFSFIFVKMAFAFSIFGFTLFEDEKVKSEKSSTSLQAFKGLNVKDLEKIEIKKDEEKKGIGQNLQNTNMSLKAGEDIVEVLQDSEEGGKGSTENEMTIYEVKKGDTLQSIASYFEISKDTILTVNEDVLDDGRVSVGDVLEIPPISGILYKVKKGDTLAKIASKYNLDSEDVSLYNGIIESSDLAVGEAIFLPGAKVPKTENEDLKVKNKNLAAKDKTKKDKNTTSKTLAENITTKVGKTISDVAAIVKLKKEGRNYSGLPRLDGYFGNPAPGAVRTQKMHGHNGVDLAAKVGTSILASAPGTVAVARSTGWNYGYGKYIVINHPNGTQTVYAHLNTVEVSVGQSVGKGERIAGMGNTGNSTGPHLHFEIRGAYNTYAW